MSQFDSLTEEHRQLLALQKTPPADYASRIRAFIDELQKSGRDIADNAQRDQIRSFLRFWSTTIYEIEPAKGYQVVDLDPYIGSTSFFNRVIWPNRFIIIGFLLLCAVIFIVIRGVGVIRSASSEPTIPTSSSKPTNTPVLFPTPFLTFTAEFLQIATQQAATQLIATLQNATLIATVQPTAIPPEVTPQPPTVLSYSISEPQNGAFIAPEFSIIVTYHDLPAGSSINVFIQSLNSGMKIYPLPESYSIPSNQTSGEWRFTTDLGKLFDLAKRDTYVLTLGLVSSKSIEDQIDLARTNKNGLADMPQGVSWQQTRPVTLNRAGYRLIDQKRLIYNDWNVEEGQSDLYTALPDGSDIIQLTHTLDLSERFPAISPDGKFIAFNGRQNVPNSTAKAYSIWIMTSDGQKRYELLHQDGYQYFAPAWSTDGNSLAYSAIYTDENGVVVHKVFVLRGIQKYLQQPDTVVLTPEDIALKGDQLSPFWTSAEDLVCAQEQGDQNTIISYNLTSKTTQSLVTIQGLSPDLSGGPDGQIAIDIVQNNSEGLYIYSPKTGKNTFLVDFPSSGVKLQRNWEDGQLYYSISSSTGDYSIWALDVSNGKQKMILPPLTYYPSLGVMKAYLPIQ